MSSSIPKIIHCCWLSDDVIPEEFQNYQLSWKKHLPDYELKRWDFSLFPKETSIWVQQAYDAKKYAFAADYIRLYALYHYGGIYMDMDVEVLKSFNSLLDCDVIIGYENQKTKQLEAGCFGAKKGNKFVEKCLAYYRNRPFIKPDGTYDILPLPQIITPIYQALYPDLAPFSSDFFTAKSQKDGRIFVTRNTYAIHHFAGSWTIPIRKKYMALQNSLSRKVGSVLARLILSPMHFLCVVKEIGLKPAIKKMLGFRSKPS